MDCSLAAFCPVDMQRLESVPGRCLHHVPDDATALGDGSFSLMRMRTDSETSL